VEGAVPQEQRIVHVNRNWQELTGYTLDEVMLTPWTLVMSGRNANNIETHSLNEAFAKGLTMAYVLTCYKKNGAGFCNHILIMHLGAVQHRDNQRSTFCIMMREIPLVFPSSSS
jgi:PAS domain S-box-containing protein